MKKILMGLTAVLALSVSVPAFAGAHAKKAKPVPAAADAPKADAAKDAAKDAPKDAAKPAPKAPDKK